MPLNSEQRAELLDLAIDVYNRRDSAEVAAGYLRYEALRKLNPARYADLVSKNLSGAATFDDMVDELVLQEMHK